MSPFVVGIDLGTTNCALASVSMRKNPNASCSIETFAILQMLDVGEVGESRLLPSYVYLPAEHERELIAESARRLPSPAAVRYVVGSAARAMGSRITGRLVGSAKSWLCNAEVDRKAAILPWGADPSVEHLSPVKASSLYLEHLSAAWNAGRPPEARLEKQHVVLTVPASFDEVARELTLEAAAAAGIARPTLLEEPQAAFYHWMHSAGDSAFTQLPVGSVCVVIDCGGGTTDFSLVAVVERDGAPQFDRLAVGDHLLLGGDNMDLALAHHVERMVSPSRRLDAAQWGNLVHGCRRAKESLLGEANADRRPVTVIGRGRQVVGGTLTTDLTRDAVRRIVLDGFFPAVGFGEEPMPSDRAALQEFGLPFVADPAITRHLASFLRRHAETIRSVAKDRSERPHAVLFNGGVFNAAACREQVLATMRAWFGSGYEPKVLVNDDLDLAVARGAAYSGWLKLSGKRRIRAGVARSYYIQVADAIERAADNRAEGTRKVACIAPHGLEEGRSIALSELPLELRVGEPVAFPLFSSTARLQDRAGDVFEAASGQLAAHPPLTTVLRGGKRAGVRRIPVILEAALTEIGTLEVHCAARDGSNRWKLQFQARSPTLAETIAGDSEADPIEPTKSNEAVASSPILETWSEADLAGAVQVLSAVFRKGGVPQEAVDLPRRLEAALQMSRDKWPKSLLRALWDPLIAAADGRKISIEHEWRWYNLAGFVLRPGWGDPIDPYRVEQLWKAVHNGVLAVRSDRALSEYWIMCRRTAGGLDASRQTELSRRIAPLLQLGGKKAPRRVGPNELAEAWRAVASCERIRVDLKVQLGNALVRQLRKPPLPGHVLWSLARIGARTLLYGPANLVVSPETAAQWATALMAYPGEGPQRLAECHFTLAQIARATGDRVRDLPESTREKVIAFLETNGAAEQHIECVRRPTRLALEEETALLGDRLPPGLTLAPE